MKHRIPIRTLIIDDDEMLGRRLHSWLTAAAYDPVAYTCAAEGLAHLQRERCELALIDMHLPDADGADVIAKSARLRPRMRIVAVGAFTDEVRAIAIRAAGAHDVLDKPLRQAELLECLGRQLAEAGIPAVVEADFNRKLGGAMRSLRQEAGRTLVDLATASGLTAAQLCQIERGKTATSTWTLARICGALRVSPRKPFEKL